MKAIVCIDVQNDFIDGTLGVDKDRKTTERILEYVERQRDSGAWIYATADTHLDNYLDTLEGKKLPVKHCVYGTVGCMIPVRLRKTVSKVFPKETFGSEELARFMSDVFREPHEYDEIEIFGFCTSICVISNALLLRAALPDMKISIVEDLCGDIDEESHKAALKVAQNCQIDVKKSTTPSVV